MFFYHGIKAQWFPCVAFPKHSGPLAYFVFLFSLCPGPSQSEVVSYFRSWDPNTVVPLYGVYEIQWSPCMALFLIRSWAKPIGGSIIFWIMGLKYSSLSAWCFQSTVVFLYGAIPSAVCL